MANQAAKRDQADDDMGDRMVNALDSLTNAAVLKTKTCESEIPLAVSTTARLATLKQPRAPKLWEV